MPLDVNFCYAKEAVMKKKLLVLLIVFFVAANCYAEGLSLAQKINYKQVNILSPIGQETKALVNRFTGKVEYIWNGAMWTAAPSVFQKNYDDRRSLRDLDRRNKDIRYKLQKIAESQKSQTTTQ
jgi:hypothetical protein